MALTKEETAVIVAEHGKAPADTGSPEVQIAIFSTRIKALTEHLKEFKGDHATRRGLMVLNGRRQRLLEYLRREDVERYRTLIGKLGIRDKKKASGGAAR